MTELVDWGNSAVRLRVALDDTRAVIVGLEVAGAELDDIPPRIGTTPAEVLIAGGRLPQGQRHVALGTSLELAYVSHDIVASTDGSTLELVQRTPRGVVLRSTFTVYGELPVVRVQQEVVNDSDGPVTLEATSVAFERDGGPSLGIVTALTPDGRRAMANIRDRDALESLTVEAHEGRTVRLTNDGTTNTADLS